MPSGSNNGSSIASIPSNTAIIRSNTASMPSNSTYSPIFRFRRGSRSNNSGSISHISNNLGSNNNGHGSMGAGGSESTWFMNIIPLLLICGFALAFRLMANRYSFCNISADVCGKPQVTISKPIVDDDSNNDRDDDKKNKKDAQQVALSVRCPEDRDHEPQPPVTNPAFATGLLWTLFVASSILCGWVAMKGGDWISVLLTAALAITFLGLAIDASVNGDAGRSVTAIMVMIIMTAIVVAVINIVANEGSRRVAAAAVVVALTLIGILADNQQLIKDGHVEYALTRSITMLLFVLNIVYIVVLLAIFTMVIVNHGVSKALCREFVALLLLVCMISQVAVYGSFLHKCLKKKYECVPSVTLSQDGVSQPDDVDNRDATRMGEFLARCNANGIESLNVRGTTIAISVLAVVVFLMSSPRTLAAVGAITGWASKSSAVAVILACIVLLVLSFIG